MSLLEQNVSDGQPNFVKYGQNTGSNHAKCTHRMNEIQYSSGPKILEYGHKLQRAAKEFSSKPGAERRIYRVRPERDQ